MALRVPSFLPRVALIAFGLLSLTAGLTYAAGSDVPSAPTPTTATIATPAPVVVPDVRNQAFVFAKGTLEDAGFAWQVIGSVQGYAANIVVSQSPAPGVRLVQTGAPLITLSLRRDDTHPQLGDPENTSPYEATAVQPVRLGDESALGPELPASTAPIRTLPATTTVATTTTAAHVPAPKPAPERTTQQRRPAAFTVPGGKPEPLDEIPLTLRAAQLAAWVDAHPKKTQANVSHWLYQHQWIVAGAKLGWWHGSTALQTLITLDRRVQQLWGIGADSRRVAETALAYVHARSSK